MHCCYAVRHMMMNQTPFDPRWMRLASESWLLGTESALVIWLRLSRLALRPDAEAAREVQRMVAEKAGAAALVGVRAMTGAYGTDGLAVARGGVRQYRRAVRANRRRLTKAG